MKNNDKNTYLETLKEMVDIFVIERDWKKFHSPKNIASKISVEAGELLEKFVWLDSQDSYKELEANRQDVQDEVADIFILLLSFCNSANIDLSSAMITKLAEVREKYPTEKAKGIPTKYNKL